FSPACACAPTCADATATAARRARPAWAPISTETAPAAADRAATARPADRSSAYGFPSDEFFRHRLCTPCVPTPPTTVQTTANLHWLRCPRRPAPAIRRRTSSPPLCSRAPGFVLRLLLSACPAWPSAD